MLLCEPKLTSLPFRSASVLMSGSLVMKTEQNDYMRPTMALMDQLDSPYSELSAEEIRSKLPVWNTESFFPVKRPDDPQFGIANAEP